MHINTGSRLRVRQCVWRFLLLESRLLPVDYNTRERRSCLYVLQQTEDPNDAKQTMCYSIYSRHGLEPFRNDLAFYGSQWIKISLLLRSQSVRFWMLVTTSTAGTEFILQRRISDAMPRPCEHQSMSYGRLQHYVVTNHHENPVFEKTTAQIRLQLMGHVVGNDSEQNRGPIVSDRLCGKVLSTIWNHPKIVPQQQRCIHVIGVCTRTTLIYQIEHVLDLKLRNLVEFA